ncbi:GNAT family N-acetyltransferase [Parvibium lacunae]|uniref:L-ornithine N(alpha)-acyltransferase n=1 Tax=Parvibium lacunae TaxID=1888893 RepID=A0A368L7J0_9BURK|nr:GNAT family N-acetyltransferase [Parvibium lacunae]RCS59586.1 GNAT family N-acetyltransferase [Parvibium lacunae]
MSALVNSASTLIENLQETVKSGLPIAQGNPIGAAEFDASRFAVGFTNNLDEIREAQRLRYQVFTEDMGAQLKTRLPGIDEDIFDAWCDHLIVRDRETDEVVGTYRVLTPERAKQLGCYYAESEFFINRLDRLRPNMVELGRSCVHADYRQGGVIMLLWSALAQYMQHRGYHYLIGCVSVSMRDGGHQAASLYRQLANKYMAAAEYHVFPKHPVPLAKLDCGIEIDPPPLVKGYLRIGAQICGDPAWDPDFNTADFLMLFNMAQMNRRYAKHFGLA